MKILVEENNGNKLYRTREAIIISGEVISVSYSETLEDSAGNVIHTEGGLGYALEGDYYAAWHTTDTAGATIGDTIEAAINGVLAQLDINAYLYPD